MEVEVEAGAELRIGGILMSRQTAVGFVLSSHLDPCNHYVPELVDHGAFEAHHHASDVSCNYRYSASSCGVPPVVLDIPLNTRVNQSPESFRQGHMLRMW